MPLFPPQNRRERLRQIVESEGNLACQIQQKGLLEISFGAEDCKTVPDGLSRVPPKSDSEFVACMEDILDIY